MARRYSLALCLVSCLVWLPNLPAQETPDFETDVAPVLIRRCLECHKHPDASGGLTLSSADSLTKGGDSGPAVRIGSAKDSLLFQRVFAGEMPPPKHEESRKLPATEIDVLRRWIDAGAPFPSDRRLDLYEQTTDVRGGRDWWSFQPLKNVAPPHASTVTAGEHPIDAFIAEAHQEHGLSAAPPASTSVLVRRLYWDVTGLPAPIDAAAKLSLRKRETPDATAELIDELLASPRFGERWARHWLDVARFAETCGYERDQVKPFAWKYRDWVVNAFNNDMPYDQFIREQLAGDEIPNRSEKSVIATGFLCLGTWNDEPNDPEDYKYERLEDLVHTTSTAFLGLTTKCARCHDHKFDPIPQVDYYRMAAAFWSGPIPPRDRALIGGPTKEELGFADVLGWTDITTSPPPLHVLKNGERAHPLQMVSAASLTCVPGEFREFAPTEELGGTTGLRLQLADWIASPRNPLTARVLVNRLWQHHFGEGLVRSSNNFGYTGDKPTHPKLLDWLAGELIRSGWSLKHIHRLILTSKTWQQASLNPKQDEYNLNDAANRFLWRAHRRRIDAESLRDSFLSATQELDLTMGGPSFYPTISPEALEGLSRKASAWSASPEADQNRRSLYIYTQRSLLPPLMTTFDLCDTTLPCGQRDVTIVAPQALTLLNNEFVHKRSEALAAKLLDGESVGLKNAVPEAWRAILRREASNEEIVMGVEHVNRQLVRFSSATQLSDTPVTAQRTADFSALSDLVLHLDASIGVTARTDGQVEQWIDQSGHAHEASQPDPARRPILVPDVINGQPAIRFRERQFLHLSGSLLKQDDFTILAVVTDNAVSGHRELLSNWSGRDGNSGSSLFVGMTNENSIRLSDAFSGVGRIADRHRPFLLTAVNGADGARVFQQHRVVAEQSQRLPERRLDTPWVIGQQGNIDGEFWNGDLALLLVFRRPLTTDERISLQNHIIARFDLPADRESSAEPKSPELLSLASLCLVLFNSNEFAYVD